MEGEKGKRCGGWQKETSNGGRAKWAAVITPGGQVLVTIKTELHWQPSGNRTRIAHRGWAFSKNPQLYADKRPHTPIRAFTHTHTVCSNAAVEF